MVHNYVWLNRKSCEEDRYKKKIEKDKKLKEDTIEKDEVRRDKGKN